MNRSLSRYPLLATGVLFVAVFAACVALAAPKKDEPSPDVDISDLNGDGLVDSADLSIFSADYLKEAVDTVDWCGFYVGTRGEERLYKKWPDYYLKHFPRLLGFIYSEYACDGSDLNRDGQVDADDLFIFSVRELEMNVESVDWCQAYEYITLGLRVYGKFSSYYQRHYKVLLSYIHDAYGCDDSFLTYARENDPKHLSRLALDDSNGEYFVTDTVVGSIFIFDPNRVLTGELKGLQKPLGIAVDAQGYLLVGNDKARQIEVWDPGTGDLLHVFGGGVIKMPTAVTIGPAGEIYVTDSKRHTVWIFDGSYDPAPVRSIGRGGGGDGRLRFPTDTEIIARDVNDTLVHEVFVADQGNQRIQVFDLHGNFLRTLEPPNVEVPVEVPEPEGGWWWGCGWGTPPPGEECPPEPVIRGTYTRLHALDSDSAGRLHVLDAFDANTVIVDPVSGDYIDVYGDWGDGPGFLKVPMDLLVTAWGQAMVTDSDTNELEAFVVP